MLPDKMEHCIVFMNSWDVSGVFWSFSKCNITIPHFPTGDSILKTRDFCKTLDLCWIFVKNALILDF